MFTKSKPLAMVLILGAIAVFAAVASAAESKKKPQYDAVITFVSEPKPAFPASLRKRGIQSGQVTTVVAVDQYGMLLDWLAIEATHRDLIPMVDDVIPLWTFYPAVVDGSPVAAVQRIILYFDASNVVSEIRHPSSTGPIIRRYINEDWTNRRHGKAKREMLWLASVDELDQYPEVVSHPKPRLSKDSLARSLGSDASFQFYIDTDGRVRMPTLYKTDGQIDNEAILAAHEALSQWRFKPLKSKGKPVVFKAIQTFEFSHVFEGQE